MAGCWVGRSRRGALPSLETPSSWMHTLGRGQTEWAGGAGALWPPEPQYWAERGNLRSHLIAVGAFQARPPLTVPGGRDDSSPDQ